MGSVGLKSTDVIRGTRLKELMAFDRAKLNQALQKHIGVFVLHILSKMGKNFK